MERKMLRPGFAFAAVLIGGTLANFDAAQGATAKEIEAGAKQAREVCFATVDGCKAAGAKAQGILVFPEVTKAALVVGGSHGKGALLQDGKVLGFYETSAASLGLELGAEKSSQVLMFMTKAALDDFLNSSGWTAGASANVTLIDQGNSAQVDSITANAPVIAFVFGQKGLMGGVSLEGAKITKIQP